MIERDYIMRMIAMLTAVIAKILDLKKAKDFPRALHELEAATKSLAGIDSGLLEAFTDEQLLELFGRDLEVAPVRWYVVGRLLAERAELYRLMGDDGRATEAEWRALSLLVASFLAPEMTPEPDQRPTIESLITQVGPAMPSFSGCVNLALYHEKAGRYMKAEDCHWVVLERDSRYAPSVRAFYARMRALPDSDLVTGGLPRGEVEEGDERLQKLLGSSA